MTNSSGSDPDTTPAEPAKPGEHFEAPPRPSASRRRVEADDPEVGGTATGETSGK